jgi:uncharacterized repeat protein (TIGR02543 family)
MKKGIFAIFTVLAILAMVMTGCPTDGGGGGGNGPDNPDPNNPPAGDGTPVLTAIADKTISTTATAADAQLSVTVSNSAAIGVNNLKFQWYKSTVSATDAGVAFGAAVTGYNTGRNCAPDIGTVSEAWYWVVVTNTVANKTATSNKAKVTIFQAAAGTPVERIVAQNAAVPLWEFTIDTGNKWEDYTTYTVEYYVKKTSKAYTDNIRTRVYGAYFSSDFEVVDQGNTNDWGGFRMINFNGTTITRPGEASVNPNNNFILDNTGGTAASFGSIFSTASGAPSKWFKATYKTDGTTGHGDLKDYAKVTLIDEAAHPTIYLGAGIFGGGGVDDAFEFYVKNPTLVHKTDQSKNIVGKSVAQGTTERMFAGNVGSPKGGTDREILADGDDSYLDVAGNITIKFDARPGTLATPIEDVIILEGATLDTQFPTAVPTRSKWTFTGWFAPGGAAAVTSTTVLSADVTLTAKWAWDTSAGAQTAYDVPTAKLPDKNTSAWATDYTGQLFVDLTDAGFDGSVYETITIVAKYYDSTDTLIEEVIPASNIQMKFFAGDTAPANMNATALATKYNLGANGNDWTSTYDDTAETVTSTTAIPVAANTATLKWLGFQAGGSHTAQFIEIVSITFGFKE